MLAMVLVSQCPSRSRICFIDTPCARSTGAQEGAGRGSGSSSAYASSNAVSSARLRSREVALAEGIHADAVGVFPPSTHGALPFSSAPASRGDGGAPLSRRARVAACGRRIWFSASSWRRCLPRWSERCSGRSACSLTAEGKKVAGIGFKRRGNYLHLGQLVSINLNEKHEICTQYPKFCIANQILFCYN